MKKVKPVSLKTIVLGRTGKTVMHNPLAVSSNSAGSQLNQGTSSRITEAVDVDNHDVPVFSPDEAQHSTAQRRNYNSVVNWQKMRDKLFMAAVEEESLPEKAVSVVCKQHESTVRCRECCPRQFFCSTCAHDLHAERNQFHVLEQWKGNRFIPLFPNHGAIESGHSCSSRVLKLFKLIDALGNQHLFEVPVCDCESPAVTLVRCQFWPGSPERPSVGFHFKLMDLAEKLFLHSQVSVKEFSEFILEMTPPLQPNFIPSLYAILNSGCFEEYRYFKYKLRYLNSFVPELYNGAECPLCPKENGILIQSIDPCFGLARKKAKGGNTISSRHGDLLFSDQDDVNNFVDNYPQCGQKSMDQDYNRFHAGEVLPALRSKGKNRLFDEKGVFGRVCRHDFPKSLLSIKHGERWDVKPYFCKGLFFMRYQNCAYIFTFHYWGCEIHVQ
ncbi:uncharacterized protein [Montipora capricornis]|uniref:uncharacterized protein n=1 Tax=Montipora capricornis TaxID=246305 RepID=UPI0035F18DA1